MAAYIKTLKAFYDIIKSRLDSKLNGEHNVIPFSISDLRVYVTFKMRPDDNAIPSVKKGLLEW